jgi:hypothetical protein
MNYKSIPSDIFDKAIYLFIYSFSFTLVIREINEVIICIFLYIYFCLQAVFFRGSHGKDSSLVKVTEFKEATIDFVQHM